MRIHDQLKFSVRGFSLNRFTYCLDAVSMLLLLFYPLADTYFGKLRARIEHGLGFRSQSMKGF